MKKTQLQFFGLQMERSVKSLVKAGPLNPSLLLQFHLWTLKNRPNHGSDSVQSLVFFKWTTRNFLFLLVGEENGGRPWPAAHIHFLESIPFKQSDGTCLTKLDS
jgi:hypothetical protein